MSTHPHLYIDTVTSGLCRLGIGGFKSWSTRYGLPSLADYGIRTACFPCTCLPAPVLCSCIPVFERENGKCDIEIASRIPHGRSIFYRLGYPGVTDSLRQVCFPQSLLETKRSRLKSHLFVQAIQTDRREFQSSCKAPHFNAEIQNIIVFSIASPHFLQHILVNATYVGCDCSQFFNI